MLQRLLGLAPKSPLTEFSSWDEAARASRPYETDLVAFERLSRDIASGATETGLDYISSLIAVLLAQREVSVLDFGGGMAPCYFEINRVVPNLIKRWTVVDLKPVVEHGNIHLADGKLQFAAEVSEQGKSDVLLCNGVFQTMRDPYCALRDAISVADPDIIGFEKLPIDQTDRFGVLNLGSAKIGHEFPYRTLSETPLAAILSNYRMLREIRHRPDDATKIPERYLCRIYQRQ